MGLLLLAAFTVYVGDLNSNSVLLAWGKDEGAGNRIGREAHSWGRASVQIGDVTVSTTRAWARVEGLAPDTTYSYTVEIDGTRIGEGRVRTWAEKSDRLAFLVMGDFGSGEEGQRRIALAMARVVAERAGGANPIRFVLTTGDNIYAYNLGLAELHSGDNDGDWWPKFFEPYAPVLSRIPFFASPGNHDGNESEHRADLPVYLDNFFFPGGQASRWYAFNYGGLADFFGLDSTQNTLTGPRRPAYLAGGPQSAWLQQALAQSNAPWKIPYFHHSIFSAGPVHAGERNEVKFQHWLTMFAAAGVKVSFQGHEHNLQISQVNARSKGIRHFVTGAGGELSAGDIRRNMPRANVQAWAAERHFLLVEIEGHSMKVTPLGEKPVLPADSEGRVVPATVVIN